MDRVPQELEVTSNAPTPAQGAGKADLVPSRALVPVLAAAVLATIVALGAEPRPDPYAPTPSLFSLDYWRYPIERNPSARLARVRGTINMIAALPDGDRIWAVGNSGLILHSADGGRSWALRPLADKPGAPEQLKASGLADWLIRPAHAGDDPRTSPSLRDVPADTTPNAPLGNKAPSPEPSVPAKSIPSGTPDPNQAPPAGGSKVAKPASSPDPDPKQTPPPPASSSPAKPDAKPTPPPVRAQPEPAVPNFNAVHFGDARRGYVVGTAGTLLITRDGGETWRSEVLTAGDEKSGREARPDLHFIVGAGEGARPWLIAASGFVFYRPSTQQHWVAQALDTGGTGLAVVCTAHDGAAVIFSGDRRRAWASAEPGRPWRLLDVSKAGRPLWDAQAKPASCHALAGKMGPADALLLADLGIGPSVSKPPATLAAGIGVPWLYAAGGRLFTAAGEGLSFIGQGRTAPWQRSELPRGVSPRAIAFDRTGVRGWVACGGGTILHTADGGKQWVATTRLAEPLERDLGVAATGEYARYPAPWYWFALLLVGGFITTKAFRRARPPTSPAAPNDPPVDPSAPTQRGKRYEAREPLIGEQGVSDRPIDWEDPDHLGLKPIARSLSRLLRNADTQPPLTLAVTGRWGSGKSSLMNLLRSDLERWGFCPVWFNVWHHQQEEQMLAALLEALRRQLAPPFATLRGLRFRLRLLVGRSAWYWGVLFLLALILGGSVTYFVENPDRFREVPEAAAYALNLKRSAAITDGSIVRLEAGKVEDELVNAAKAVTGLLFASQDALLAAAEKQLQANAPNRRYELTAEQAATLLKASEHVPPKEVLPEFPAAISALVAGMLSLPLILVVLFKGASAFGINPLSLISVLRSHLGVRGFAERLGFRHQFSQEFALVTCAVRPQTLLIVIDDLDRCAAENVIRTLEMVNFLVSSGNCYIVLGIDRKWVEACVALHYEKVADFVAEATPGETTAQDKLAERIGFARRYLEKLINIEVPMPEPQPEQTRRMLTARGRARPVRPRVGPLLAVARFWRGARRQSPPRVIAGPARLAGWCQAVIGRRLARRGCLALVLVVAGLAAGYWLNGPLRGEHPEPRPIRPQAAVPASERATESPAGPTERETSPQSRPDGPADSRPEMQPGSAPTTIPDTWLVVTILAALGGLAAFGRRTRRILDGLPSAAPVVRDSRDFSDALYLWHPWVVLLNRTPRSVKQFKNRVRYLAGLQRREPEPRNLVERFMARAWRWLGGGSGIASGEQPIPEPLLVALGAIHHCNPDWLRRDDDWQRIEARQFGELLAGVKCNGNGPPPGAAESLRQAIDDFTHPFPGLWPPTPEQRARFLLMASGIRA